MKAEDPRAERWRELTVQALYEAGLARNIYAVAGVRGAGVPDSYRCLSGPLWGLKS